MHYPVGVPQTANVILVILLVQAKLFESPSYVTGIHLFSGTSAAPAGAGAGAPGAGAGAGAGWAA